VPLFNCHGLRFHSGAQPRTRPEAPTNPLRLTAAPPDLTGEKFRHECLSGDLVLAHPDVLRPIGYSLGLWEQNER
jgi:hypothetical protein